MSEPIYSETPYGFSFGAATITRLMLDRKRGWIVLGLSTPKHSMKHIQIYVTRTGKVRIVDPRSEWTSPNGKTK